MVEAPNNLLGRSALEQLWPTEYGWLTERARCAGMTLAWLCPVAGQWLLMRQRTPMTHRKFANYGIILKEVVEKKLSTPHQSAPTMAQHFLGVEKFEMS